MRRGLALAAACLLGAHAALAVDSLWSKSATFDETTHLPAGMALVATGEARLNPQHPPFVKLLAGLAIVAAAQAGTALLAHPDHLAYFNPLAGGTRAGPRWLDDSNLDWGQDLYRLPAWLAERGIGRVRLLYLGTAVPGAYGVTAVPLLPSDWKQGPRPGAYVISAHWLVHGLYQAATQRAKSDWLERYQPVDVLGGSLYLYVFPERRTAGINPEAGGSRGP